MLSFFELYNSSFNGEKLLQNTNYIDIQQSKKLSIWSNSFVNCSYINVGDSGVYLIYIEKIYATVPAQQSFIQDIMFDKIKTNAISFGGFEDLNVGGASTLTV